MVETVVTPETVHLLSMADKLGVVSILVGFILYLTWKAKQDHKLYSELMTKFIDESKARGERVERQIEQQNIQTQALREILTDFKVTINKDLSDLKQEVKTVKMDLDKFNNKFQ